MRKGLWNIKGYQNDNERNCISKLVDDTKNFIGMFFGKDFVPEHERYKLQQAWTIVEKLQYDLHAEGDELLTFGERWELSAELNRLLKGGCVGQWWKTHRYIESHNLRGNLNNDQA